MNPFIIFDHVTFRHPGSNSSQAALQDVSVTINAGEWVAIVGANGSGKTTFARLCNALLTPTTGRVIIDKLDTQEKAHLPAIRSKVGVVFQNPEDQIVATIVEEDTAFGPENLAIPTREIRERVDSALTRVGMFENRLRPPHLLSAGQMQRVALAGILAMKPDCVIFDESTAMLDPRGRQEVLAAMKELHDQGVTVLFITHFMEEASRAERTLVFNKGAVTFDGKPTALFSDLDFLKASGLEQPVTIQVLNELRALSPLFTGISANFEQALKELPAYSGKKKVNVNPLDSDHQEKLVEISHLNHTYAPGTPLALTALQDISLAVTSGKAHGLAGATGSGKSTLLQHLNGLYRPQSGTIRIGSFSLSDPDLDVKALRRFAGLVFQNPEIYFFKQYVGDEIAYGPKLLFGRDGLKDRVRQAMTLVGLDFESFKDRLTYNLSGGEKRKVALASTLAIQPKVLILDEPTAGLDPGSRRNLHATLKRFQANGIELIFSSHSMGDIAELTQNLTIMSEGKALRTGDTAVLFNDSELINSASLGVPSIVRMAAALREKHWPIPVGTIKTDQLIGHLQRLAGGKS